MVEMNCQEVRAKLVDLLRGRVTGEERRALELHVSGCKECQSAAASERALDRALERMPRRAASPELVRSLRERYGAKATAQPAPAAVPVASLDARAGDKRSVLRSTRVWSSAAAVLAVAAGALVFSQARSSARTRANDALVAEAVNDHLRVLYSEHPIDVESGGMHQVKPWFAGRLDFAPVIQFSGDADYPLQGGSVAYFVDRKAAAYVFHRRLHTITVFVFRHDGLDWPLEDKPVGNGRGHVTTMRGFNTILMRSGDLGYALVSDLNATELQELAQRVVP